MAESYFTKKYYTTTHKVRKQIECPNCNKLTFKSYIMATQRFVSGTGYVFRCEACDYEETHIL